MTEQQPTIQEQFDAALKELTPQQARFVREYLRDLHQRNAAVRAGYSEKTADVQASRLLSSVKIRAAVDFGLKLAAMPADEVIARLSDEARADMSDFLRVDEQEVVLREIVTTVTDAEMVKKIYQTLGVEPTDDEDAKKGVIIRQEIVKLPVARLDLVEAGRRGKLGLIAEYTIDDKGNQKIKLVSAHAARVELAKIHGLIIDRKELAGPGGKSLFPDFEQALEKTYADGDAPTTE
jgi:phage terminase small subunit